MLPPTLDLETKKIFVKCPRLRVLVVGRSGVGKSSLIKYAFGVDIESVSHGARGECEIDREIISPQNHRFVLHDSKGFEPGDTANLDLVQVFLQKRNGDEVTIEQRVHIIWLCVQTPFAGGRVFETGDEKFLNLATQLKSECQCILAALSVTVQSVPVVVVFTQFDRLVAQVEEDIDLDDAMTDKEIAQLVASESVTRFEHLCAAPLRKVNSTLRFAQTSGLSEEMKPDRKALNNLLMITRDVVDNDTEGDGWILAAIAQRASAELNIMAGIEIGMRGYWRGLAAGAKIPSSTTLVECLDTIHIEMTNSWNFHDPNDLLTGLKFREEIRILAQLVTPDEKEVASWFKSENLGAIQTLLGLVAGVTVAATVGPVIAVVGLTAYFAKFIFDAYHSTPKTLRCFMGYLLDVTLVLNELFLQLLPMRPPRTVTEDAITTALETYQSSQLGRIHREIRELVKEMKWHEIKDSDWAEEKVKELIIKYTS